MDKEGFVYVLQCERETWYVGWSADLHTRIASHFLGAAAKWTKLHKPIAVHSVRPGGTVLENCITVALMCQYGWEKVRGGSYTTVEMEKAPACISKAMHYATFRSHANDRANTQAHDQQLQG